MRAYPSCTHKIRIEFLFRAPSDIRLDSDRDHRFPTRKVHIMERTTQQQRRQKKKSTQFE